MMYKLLLAMATLVACLLLTACGTSTGGYGNMHTPAAMMAASQPRPTAADDQLMYLRLIHKMQQRGMYFASLAHIDAYAKRYGATPELGILHANALRETGQPDAAADIYRTLREGPQAAAAWHGLGLVAAAKGDYAQAADDLQQAVQHAPINATYLGDLGYAQLRAGDPASARSPLAKAAELDPDSTKAIANLALLLLVQGHAAPARAMMEKAQLPPATRRAVSRQAASLRRQYRQTTSVTPAPPQATSLASGMTASGVPHNTGISSNVLERFTPAPAAGETRHAQP